MRGLIAGKYEVVEEIGQGAAGTTCKVRDKRRGSIVTLRLRPDQGADDPEQRAAVEQRVQLARELRHDHIVPVLGLARQGSQQYVVEEWVDAEPLDHVLRQRRALPPADALHVARQLADALACAHERGVIHGGLTPASVLIRSTVPPRAMLAAFGSADLEAGRAAVPPALLPYAAPERLMGGDLDARIDVFALGLVLFEMLEGRRLFSSADEHELRNLLLDGSGPLLPRFTRILPPGVSALVARMIRRSPAKRPSAAQVRSEIEAFVPRVPSGAPGAGASKAPTAVPAAATITATPAEAKKRVTVQMPALEADEPCEPSNEPSNEPILARRVLVRAGAPRPKTPVAGVALIAAVVVALGWPLIRWVSSAPAASGQLSSPAPSVPPRLRVPVVAEPVAKAEERGPAVADPPAAPTTASPDAGAAQESSVRATDADAAAGDTDARQRDGVPVPEADEPSGKLGAATLGPPPNVAPRIVGYRPRSRDPLSVMEGAPVDFSVRATDQDLNDPVTYAWFLDGRRVSQRPGWRFVPPLAATAPAHTVEVRVTDRSGLQAPHLAWRVEVSARLSDVSVRDWLGRLAGAWERKDVSTLRLYGIVTTDAEADALRKRLAHSDGSRVSISNETIRTRGRYATVAFDLTELDRRGKVVSSRRESYELEKQPSGFVGLRSPAAATR